MRLISLGQESDDKLGSSLMRWFELENTPTNRKETLLHQKKPLFPVAIFILACMRYDAKTGWMFATLLLGICELFDAVKHHRNQKRGLAIASLCLGIFLCGVVFVEVLEIVLEKHG